MAEEPPSLNPVLSRLGLDAFCCGAWEHITFLHIWEGIEKRPLPKVKLECIVFKTAIKDYQDLTTAHPLLKQLVFSNRRFVTSLPEPDELIVTVLISLAGTALVHLPSEAAVLIYAKSEVNLLWSSILAAKSRDTFIHLTLEQKKILLQLNLHLSQWSKAKELEKILHSAICSLYMPKTTLELANDAFQSPVAAFQALQVSNKDKTFAKIGSMDQKLNPLQFMIQLRGISQILKTAADNEVNYTDRGSNPLMWVFRSTVVLDWKLTLF